jgi:hypothetical protein
MVRGYAAGMFSFIRRPIVTPQEMRAVEGGWLLVYD